MSASGGGTFADLLGEVLAEYVANAAASIARWAYVGWWSFLVYVVLVFMLAATGYQSEAFVVFALIPALAILAVVFVVPGMALGVVIWPAVRETRIGSVVGRLLQRFLKGVVGGGWFSFSLGNDVSDIMRFQWTHPWLSALLCVFAIPAVLLELRGEKEWGFWGVGACVVSGMVYGLDILRFLSNGSG